MRAHRPAPKTEVLTIAEWEFLEHLKAMKEARHHPYFEGESDRAAKRQRK